MRDRRLRPERLLVVAVLGVLSACHHRVSQQPVAQRARYLDSDEAKDPEYNHGCAITDYAGVVEQEQVKWAWVDPGVKLASLEKIEVAPVKNMSDTTDPKIGADTEQAFKAAFERVGKSVGRGGAKFNACIFWLQRASSSRAMVPYAGIYLAQAGIGIEAVITDQNGKTIAKIRHDGREGHSTDDASFEIVDEIANFVRDH